MDKININQEFIETQNNLIDIMFDLSCQMNESKNYIDIEANFETMDKLSTIIKRIGDSVVLAISQPQSGNEGENNGNL
jgi:hypothetical protein